MKYDCGKSLDEYGYHLITCKNDGGLVWSHNSVVRAYSHLCMVHKIESKHRLTADQTYLLVILHRARILSWMFP